MFSTDAMGWTLLHRWAVSSGTPAANTAMLPRLLDQCDSLPGCSYSYLDHLVAYGLLAGLSFEFNHYPQSDMLFERDSLTLYRTRRYNYVLKQSTRCASYRTVVIVSIVLTIARLKKLHSITSISVQTCDVCYDVCDAVPSNKLLVMVDVQCTNRTTMTREIIWGVSFDTILFQ
jgi:hypothetical protein